jgi:hypothetical protein
MPLLHTSAYLAKKASSSSGCTTVLSLIFAVFARLPFPSVACIMTGKGCDMSRSEKSSVEGVVDVVVSGVQVTSRYVRCVTYEVISKFAHIVSALDVSRHDSSDSVC